MTRRPTRAVGIGSPFDGDIGVPGCADDAGFGLIEVLVAVFLLTIVVLIVLRGTITAMSASVLAKEHSVATSLITGAVAEVTALPFADLQAGLNPVADNLLADPTISQSGSTYTFVPTGATIPTSNTNTSETPLVPHVETTTVGIPYNVAVYPTTTSASPGLVTVNVLVTWTAPTGGLQTASGQAQIAAP